jgi:hypothetical protein
LPPLPSTPTAAKDFIPRDFAKALVVAQNGNSAINATLFYRLNNHY